MHRRIKFIKCSLTHGINWAEYRKRIKHGSNSLIGFLAAPQRAGFQEYEGLSTGMGHRETQVPLSDKKERNIFPRHITFSKRQIFDHLNVKGIRSSCLK